MAKIERDTFKSYDTDSKLLTLFDRSNDIYDLLEFQNNRIKKVENRKLIDKISSGIGGIIGGALAIIGKWLYFR